MIPPFRHKIVIQHALIFQVGMSKKNRETIRAAALITSPIPEATKREEKA